MSARAHPGALDTAPKLASAQIGQLTGSIVCEKINTGERQRELDEKTFHENRMESFAKTGREYWTGPGRPLKKWIYILSAEDVFFASTQLATIRRRKMPTCTVGCDSRSCGTYLRFFTSVMLLQFDLTCICVFCTSTLCLAMGNYLRGATK